MADNVKIWEPTTGPLVASDDVGGVQFQKIKLDLGADGASVPVSGTVPVSGPVTNTELRAMPVPIYSMPVELQATMTGLVGGKAAKIVQVLGRRTVFQSATAWQDACQFLVGGQAEYTEPAVGTTYYAVSTSANDKAGSAGVSKVRLVSLNAASVQQVTEITLNGTTPVSIGAGYTYFQWMESSVLGGALKVAAGDIAISSTNGVATEATTMLIIKAGGNKSMDGKYRVPAGYTGYLVDWYSAAISQAMDTRLRAAVFSDDRTLSPDVYHFQDTMYLAAAQNSHQPLAYLKLIAGADIKVSTIPSAVTGSPRLDANVTLLLIAD